MFNEFEMMKITLKNVLGIVMRTWKTVSIKPCINREDKIMSSQFRYADIAVIIRMNFLSVVKLTPIYYGWYTQKICSGKRSSNQWT